MAAHQLADQSGGDEGTVLCEIDWIDRPEPGEITQLMEAAADALDEMTDRLIAERDS